MTNTLKILLSLFCILGVGKLSIAEEEGKDKPNAKVTIIQAGTLLAIPGEGPLEKQSIFIEDGKIAEVQNGFQSGNDLEDTDVTIINLQDKFVMPGLMDVHVHLVGGRGNAADHAIAGVVNAKKTLDAGYTTVRDIGAPDDTIYKLRTSINKGDVIGPRIFSAGQIIGVGSRTSGKECNGQESCRRTARDNINEGADWIKIYSSCSGSKLCSHKDGAPMFFEDEIEAVFEVAKKHGVKVAAHSHPRDSALMVLNYDISSIEHGSFMNDVALKKMVEKGVFFVPTVSVHDMLERVKKEGKIPDEMIAHNDTFLEGHPDTIMRAYEMGVKLATGSDAGIVPHGKNYREIERFVDMGISKSDALMMATVNTADLLDKSDDLGTIEAGKLADIIALDGDPLHDIKDIEKVSFVMKEGKVYKKD